MKFDPSEARSRLDKFWSLPSAFGKERSAYHVFLHEIVRDRFTLTNGLQLLRDELHLSPPSTHGNEISPADFTLPSVLTTLAHTQCGDRIHPSEARQTYEQAVASRFAVLSEIGGPKLESFTPAGGGTDHAGTLVHVTVTHNIDKALHERLYNGNPKNFHLVNIDLQAHVGRHDEADHVEFGRTRESPWRAPRGACGAILGALKAPPPWAEANASVPHNSVSDRLNRQLGIENHALLARDGSICTPDGVALNPVVAAAIILVRSLKQTLFACTKEAHFDERCVAHVTASLTVNRVSQLDTVIYLARGTVFQNDIRVQGFGLDAELYSGALVDQPGDRRLELRYDNVTGTGFSVREPDRSTLELDTEEPTIDI